MGFSFLFKNKYVKAILDIVTIIYVYGFLVTIILNTFFGINYSLQNITGFGLMWYFLKYELPLIFVKYVGGH